MLITNTVKWTAVTTAAGLRGYVADLGGCEGAQGEEWGRFRDQNSWELRFRL